MYLSKIITIVIFSSIMLANTSICAKLVENKLDKVIKGYHSFYYQAKEGNKLRFRFFMPAIKEGQKYPLVVHFHGAGSRGSDNIKPINLASTVTNGDYPKKYPCFVFVPQCPGGRKWVNLDWHKTAHKQPEKPNIQMKMAMEAIDEIIKKYPIDTTRIYVFGQSMGGFATWDIICRKPELFAAAVPVCGGGDVSKAGKIANLPIWAFHGALDPVVKADNSRAMITALRQAGGKPQYTEYKKVKHNAWSYSYTPELFDWMFKQKKKPSKGKIDVF